MNLSEFHLPMISLPAILLIASAAALGMILRVSVVRRLKTSGEAKSLTALRPIDVEAFRNLTNPAEDEYLRHSLPGADFRAVRRARLHAMAAYVQVAANNAALLIQAGEAALAAGDPRLAAAATQLVQEALLLRRNTTMALGRIYLALAWPGSDFAAVRVVDRYEHLSGSAMLLGRLQNPAAAVRLASRA